VYEIMRCETLLNVRGSIMTQRQKMLKSLNENVIPILIQRGFTGKFPHYRRELENRIELLVFMTDKYGGAFTVEISTIFLNCKQKLSNYCSQEFEAIGDVTVYSTINRYRLEGMLDGWFYYTDVYKSKVTVSGSKTFDYYESVSERRSKNFVPEQDQVLVQKADDSLYLKISSEVNRQMEYAYEWWMRHDTPQKMRMLGPKFTLSFWEKIYRWITRRR
jgi:hypothetical protein